VKREQSGETRLRGACWEGQATQPTAAEQRVSPERSVPSGVDRPGPGGVAPAEQAAGGGPGPVPSGDGRRPLGCPQRRPGFPVRRVGAPPQPPAPAPARVLWGGRGQSRREAPRPRGRDWRRPAAGRDGGPWAGDPAGMGAGRPDLGRALRGAGDPWRRPRRRSPSRRDQPAGWRDARRAAGVVADAPPAEPGRPSRRDRPGSGRAGAGSPCGGSTRGARCARPPRRVSALGRLSSPRPVPVGAGAAPPSRAAPALAPASGWPAGRTVTPRPG
jgi:hypothetical protein